MTTTNMYHSKVGFIYALTQNQFDHIHFLDDIIRTFLTSSKILKQCESSFLLFVIKFWNFFLKKRSFGIYIDCKHWTRRLCCPEIYSGDTIIQEKTKCFPKNDLLLVKNWLFWQLLFFFLKKIHNLKANKMSKKIMKFHAHFISIQKMLNIFTRWISLVPKMVNKN